MTPNRTTRLRVLFDEAVGLPADSRAAFIAAECGDDAELRQELETLLAHDSDRPDDFLASSVIDFGAPDVGSVLADRFQLDALIGEGGMGAVYRATQLEPIRRAVAVKVVKLGMDTRQVISRFQSERQTLALMSHPGIARVLDAGATRDGRPFFVMELVEGDSITTYCDRQRLGTNDRLRLFIDVCRAVQHAHQKGVLHRDLKPSNILVHDVDGRPVPKVIDFGIAKAFAGDGGVLATVTDAGQVIGTPHYMSPEQATGHAVDTRSDVYALGVILYELLVGEGPLGRLDVPASPDEVRRRVREEDPLTPSTRWSRLDHERRRAVADQRRTLPASLLRTLRGDLDWITLKAIAKEPSQRYDSAAELATDVDHHLRDLPVSARPPSARDRARKVMRRHRALVIGSVAVLTTLIAGVISTSVFAVLQSRDRAAAERQARIAEQVVAFLNEDLLGAVAPGEQGRNVSMREVLDAAALRVEGRFDDEPLVEAAIRRTLGTTYWNLGAYGDAERHYARAMTLFNQELGPDDKATLGVELSFARLDHSVAPDADTVAEFDALLARISRNLGDDSDLMLSGRITRAGMDVEAGRLEKAELESVVLVAEATERFGEDAPRTLDAMSVLANAVGNRGRYADAIDIERRMLAIQMASDQFGARHPETLSTQQFLVESLMRVGDFDEAESLCRDLVAQREDILGPHHARTIQTIGILGHVILMRSNYDDAEPYLDTAHRGSVALLGVEHPQSLVMKAHLAAVYVKLGRLDEAAELLETVLDVRTRVNGPNHPQTLSAVNELGNIHVGRGDYARAEPLTRRTMEAYARELGPDHPYTLIMCSNLATVLRQLERFDEAITLHHTAIDGARRRPPDEQWQALLYERELGVTFAAAGRPEDGAPIIEHAYAGLREKLGSDSGEVRKTAGSLATLYDDWGRPDDAARWRAASRTERDHVE